MSTFRAAVDRYVNVALLCLCAALLPACTGPSAESSKTSAPAFGGIHLRLLVVDDQRLADKCIFLQGEWNARTGATFEVTTCSEAELESRDSLSADAVIYPAYGLGALAERKQIVPLPAGFETDAALGWPEVFDLLRTRCLTWSDAVYAVPLGSPSLICYYRADLFRQFDRRPPATWAEYQQLAEFFNDRENLGPDAPPDGSPWSGTLEPLGPGWAGMTLLARAAGYAKHPSNYSALFNIDTLEPLVDGPPFVRALDELVAAARLTSKERRAVDPNDVRRRFWHSQTAMALCWPTNAAKFDAAETTDESEVNDKLTNGKTGSDDTRLGSDVRNFGRTAIEVGFARLPAERDVYNPSRQSWGQREEPAGVPLLGVAGRVASIAAQSEHPKAAFTLLTFLTGTEWGADVASATPATTLYTRTQSAGATRWAEKPAGRTAAEAYSRIVKANLNGPDVLFTLRIPGRDDYLAALDEAVERAITGDVTSEESLQQAATRWREITIGRGLESQRRAYRRSLGLSP